jgi:hypothetical protein
MHRLFAPEPVEKPTSFEIADSPPSAEGQDHVDAEMVQHCRSIWRQIMLQKIGLFPRARRIQI